MVFICAYCDKVCKNKNSKAQHERFCVDNPNKNTKHIEQAKHNRLKANKKTEICEYCELKYRKGDINRHIDSCKKNPKNLKICPVCKETYTGGAQTCGYSCSNVKFRHNKLGGARYQNDEQLKEKGKYTQLCFRHHEKGCVICGETKIVAVHHLDENHENNEPRNLIPLCPTHHQYWHSRHKYLIEQKIYDYIGDWVSG